MSTPAASTCAIDPPPAPMLAMSTAGMITGKSPTAFSVEVRTSPPSTRPMSALVPPMSNATSASWPEARPSAAAATTPDAGPDRSVSTGRSTARAALMMPPLDLVLNTGALTPSSASEPTSRSK